MSNENVERVEFECEGCNTSKEAYVKESDKKRKAKHKCRNCERTTVWIETGWVEIEIE